MKVEKKNNIDKIIKKNLFIEANFKLFLIQIVKKI